MIINKKIFFIIFGGVFLLIIFFIIGMFVERKTMPLATGGAFPEFTTSSAPMMEAAQKTEVILPDRKIIKTGNLSLEVENVPEAIRKIREYTETEGGFVVESRIEEREQIPYGSITMRIPSEKFDDAFGDIKQLAKKVVEEFVSGEDVTEEYYDADAELRNLQETEKQFLQILKDAKTIEDILAVRRELKDVRTQIDILKGRLQYLDRSVSLSSIYISLSTDESALPVLKEKDWHPIATIKNAARGLVSTVRVVIYGIIWIAVFGIIWIPFFFLGRYFWKRKKTRRI